MFSIESKAVQALGRVADLMLLNILFLLTSLPIVTAGAAWTALYDVCFRITSDRDEKLIRHYFRAFRENFRSSTGIWLVLLTGRPSRSHLSAAPARFRCCCGNSPETPENNAGSAFRPDLR